MIEFTIGLLGGATIGIIISAFTIGATANEREREAYMEGYLVGKKEAEGSSIERR